MASTCHPATNHPINTEPVELDPTVSANMMQIFSGDKLPPIAQIRAKPLTLLLAKTGTVEVRTYPQVLVTRQPGSKDFVHVINPLPWSLYAKIVGFFKDVYDKHKAEALCILWTDPEGGVAVTVPRQAVSGSRVEPDDTHYEPPSSDKPWTIWGHIHSHNTMTAFFSGTDDSGETQDGLIFGVVGKITQRIPEVKWRTRVCGAWVELSLDDIVKNISFPTGVHEEWMKQVRPISYAKGVSTAYNGYRHSHDTRQVPAVVDKRRVDQSAITHFNRVIRKDGSTLMLWRDGSFTPMGVRVEDLSEREINESLQEGLDWNAAEAH
jgi:hypothetical protein